MRSGPILVVALAIIAGCGRQHQPHQPVKTTRNASSPSASPTRSAADEIWLEDWTDLETVTFKPGAARHNRYSFASAIKGTRFIRIDALPRVERLPISLLFEGEPTPPTTAAGKLAHSLGWAVVGEAGIGALTIVGISRGYKYVAGRFDYQADGNIAIFEGTALLAILQRRARDHIDIGFPEELASGAVRVTTSLPFGPVGDLVLTGHRLRFGPTEPVDRHCRGRAMVPNIFGLRIERARAILRAAGWRPRRVTYDGFPFVGAAFHRAGIHEVSYCVSDQAGQCHFSYQSPLARLEVETAQDDWRDDVVPTKEDSDLAKKVIWYGVKCRARSGNKRGHR